MNTKINEVLSEWKSQSKIAELLMIHEDDVWNIFHGRRIIQKKCVPNSHYPHNYIMLYKENDNG